MTYLHNYEIIVPKDQKAFVAVDFDNYSEEDVLFWNLSEDEISFLKSSGVFDTINAKCDVLIDFYESECISSLELLNMAKKSVESSSIIDYETGKKLLFFLEEAIKYGTGVFFFL